MNSQADYLVLFGHICGIYGVKGGVKIYSQCRPIESIFNYKIFIAQNNQQKIQLDLQKFHKSGESLIAFFSQITNRDQAVGFKDYQLFVPRSALPKLTNGEFYWVDLLGLTVINKQNQTLGIVNNIFATGANDVLVIKNSEKEYLIPLIKDYYLLDCDFKNKTLLVDWQTDWEDD